jgi:hypothetical protein
MANALATPQKRLFISLITRDIALADAVLDLLDNSINSAIASQKLGLETPADYISLLKRNVGKGTPPIRISFDKRNFEIEDEAGGISLKDAEDGIFQFGRSPDHEDHGDTLSVYGIGMKRAIFKIGDRVQIWSNHPETGFSMDLRVRAWEQLKQDVWSIPIDALPYDTTKPAGTKIKITHLFPDISRRIDDDAFEGELRRKIARTYSYFLQRIISVSVNTKIVEPAALEFRENVASDQFTLGDVACSVIAGIYVPDGRFYQSDLSGWYVFCNGRAVAFADKTMVTGWGTLMPSFQPKHRPFLGLVFFTANDPEELPWTTTKAGINQESAIWQHALRVMSTVGRQITSYLDSRYSDAGTEISIADLAEAAGTPTSAFAAPSMATRTFSPVRQRKTTTSIQITVQKTELDEIRTYLGNRSMPNTEVGRYIFDYFLNEVVRE